MSTSIHLLLSDARGQYIPRDFCRDFNPVQWGFPDKFLDDDDQWHSSDWDWDTCLQGPDSLAYWEAWDGILTHAKFTDPDGFEWLLYQDGDLWAVCEAKMTDKEYAEFFSVCRHCGGNSCFGECQEEPFPEAPEEVCYVL